ncbi:MAG TPA: glutamyl-tRNA reductase [bacterium]|nr:glutamyl-tRNA reductase [bacterium]
MAGQAGKTGECSPLVAELRMAGLNHKTAPVSVREKAALPRGAGDALAELRDKMGLSEVVALSTCNRTEFYWTGAPAATPLAIFQDLLGLDPDDLKQLSPCLYAKNGMDVARHLFQVACGMDSMVLGETQILNQVKRAYERSRERGLTDTALNLLFQKTFEVSKKVHTQTRLSAQRPSVPSAALKLTEAIFDDLTSTPILVIGTGEIAQVTVESLKKRGARNIFFVTRSASRAKIWEEKHPGAEVSTIDNLDTVLAKADIVISCTHTDEPLITAEKVKLAMTQRAHRNHPFLLLDLGIPRNIAPEAGRLGNVYLHDIDHLQKVVEKDRSRLEAEVAKAGVIIGQVLDNYAAGCREAEAGAAIREVRSRAQAIADLELERTLKRLPDLTPKQQQEVATLVHRIMGKLLHAPAEELRTASKNGKGDEATHWARRLFGIAPADNDSETD